MVATLAGCLFGAKEKPFISASHDKSSLCRHQILRDCISRCDDIEKAVLYLALASRLEEYSPVLALERI